MFGTRLQDRVVVVASAIFLVAIVVAIVLVDHRHRRMVSDRAALEARTLRVQLVSRTRLAAIVDSDEVRVVVPPEAAAAFLEPGRSAWIAAAGSVLWHSGGPGQLSRPGTPGRTREGIVSVDGADGAREVYRSVETVPHRLARPIAHGSGRSAGDPAKPSYYTYPLSYHVVLDYAPYRREITDFRIDLAGVAVIAMALLFVATRAAVHYQLRPLARVTGDVGRLTGRIGETVDRSRQDPEEVRVLAERINRFLVALDETRIWEQDMHRQIRATLDAMKDSMLSEEVSQGGFMHSLNHMLGDILLMDFRAVSEEDKAELQHSVERMRDMLTKRLNTIVSQRRTGPVPVTDIVPAVERFRIFMSRRYGDRAFVIEGTAARLPVRVPADDVSEMIGNLLRNAGAWSRETVVLELSGADGIVRITIEDDGPGFPAGDREGLLTWARGAGSAAGGHGIGLPYVNSLACSYGGGLHLSDSAGLGGAQVVLELPLVPPDEMSDQAPVSAAIRPALPGGPGVADTIS